MPIFHNERREPIETLLRFLVAELLVGKLPEVLPDAIVLLGQGQYQNFFQSEVSSTKPSILIVQSDLSLCEPSLPLSRSFTALGSHQSFSQVRKFLLERFGYQEQKVEQIHAGLVIIDGVGVLISGPSGSGKSRLVRQLLDDGHVLVSDDVVELSRNRDGSLLGQAPATIHNVLHCRREGFICVSEHWGEQAVALNSPVDVIFRVESDKDPATYATAKDVYRFLDNNIFEGCVDNRMVAT